MANAFIEPMPQGSKIGWHLVINPPAATRAVAFAVRLWLLLPALAATAGGAPLDDAIAKYHDHAYDEAKAILEKITAADPKNAEACYYLGMTLQRRGGAAGLKAALPWLQKAAELAPANADYLADYGGTSLRLAAIERSFLAAVRGRDAMEKALRIDPTDIDTRQGLFEFYVQAPWPLGSSAKAAAQLAEIARADPARAAALNARLKADARDYDAAFRLCDELLAKNPADYAALYELGRTAALSGRELERGLASLRRALSLPPPSPASPSAADIWRQSGAIEEKLGHRAEARAAYEAALARDPEDAEAAAALRRLK